MGRRAVWLTVAASAWLFGCRGGPPAEPGDGSGQEASSGPGVRPVTEVAPPPVAPPPAVRFQPAHHLALRASVPVPVPSTFRLRLPLQRGGERVRVTFRAGDGALQVLRAFVATEAHPTPLPLRFGEAAGATLQPWEATTTAPVALTVGAGEDLLVTFEAQGALAASSIEHLPRGERRDGQVADRAGPLGGGPWRRAVGVTTVDVEGPPTAAVVAIGDSITEGYVSSLDDDVREAWPHVAALRLGIPVVNAGVSGQGLTGALAHLDAEVLALEGISDCVVFLGTNDLHSHTAEALAQRLTELYGRLRPFCRVWGATLLPKERSSNGPLSVQLEHRRGVNAWLRGTPPVEGVLDFDAVLRNPSAPDSFLPGTAEDGIHPNEEGLRLLGEEAARFLGEKGLGAP